MGLLTLFRNRKEVAPYKPVEMGATSNVGDIIPRCVQIAADSGNASSFTASQETTGQKFSGRGPLVIENSRITVGRGGKITGSRETTRVDITITFRPNN